MAVRLALVVEPRHRLLADITALGEAHRALVQTGLLGNHAVVEVQPVAGAPVLDAHDLRRGLAHARRARSPERLRHGVAVLGVAEDVDAGRLRGAHEPYGTAGDL